MAAAVTIASIGGLERESEEWRAFRSAASRDWDTLEDAAPVGERGVRVVLGAGCESECVTAEGGGRTEAGAAVERKVVAVAVGGTDGGGTVGGKCCARNESRSARAAFSSGPCVS